MYRRLPVAVFLLLVHKGVVEAQDYAAAAPPSTAETVKNNFQPSLAVVIGILSIMFSVTFILLIYAKFCHRGSATARADFLRRQGGGGLVRSASRFSGIDKTVVESLPFFRFSSLRGNRQGLECAVCISKFEDVEILRLLPKCKHAFHIDCIDQWLERHSSCPICRSKVNADDPAIFAYSNSTRMMWGQSSPSPPPPEAAAALFVEREGSGRISSSRFSMGGGSGVKGEEDQEAPILEQIGGFHKFNHRIVVSDFVFKNRWSTVTSSDLMFLSSEMLIEEGLGQSNSAGAGSAENCSREIANSVKDRRSVSEMSGISRFRSMESAAAGEAEERRRKLWFPIARRTAEWFANRR
ncbi:Putative RING-H2 finger protein ATL12 [Linum perenne]